MNDDERQRISLLVKCGYQMPRVLDDGSYAGLWPTKASIDLCTGITAAGGARNVFKYRLCDSLVAQAALAWIDSQDEVPPEREILGTETRCHGWFARSPRVEETT